MKILLIAVLLTTGTTAYKGCGKDNNLVVWNSERKLTWADFKDTVKSTPHHMYLAVSGITILCKYKLKENQLSDFDIACAFVKDSSWKRDTAHYILVHEQGHFDMGEIAARQCRKAFAPLLYSKIVNRKFIDSVYLFYCSKLEGMHNFYDSTIKQDSYMQPILLEKIAKDLHALRAYERQGKGLPKL
jgi:hypothetical protein